jgi:hypothetical protein
MAAAKHGRMRRTLVLPLLLSAGCGPGPELELASAALRGPGAFAIWTRDASDAATTYFVDDNGRVVASEPGIVLRSHAAGDLRWELERVRVPTAPCEYPDRPAGEGWSELPRLRPTLGAPIPVGGRDRPMRHAGETPPNEHHGTVKLVSSVGSLLFLSSSIYDDYCGVHGNASGHRQVWDLERRAFVDLEAEVARFDLERAMREAAPLLRDDQEGEEPDPVPGRAELQLTGIVAGFDQDGLRLRYQITTDACYACSRGDAGSYTISELVDAQLVPSTLAAHALLPSPVARFMRQHPELTVGGW